MSSKSSILIVDDVPENLTILSGILSPDYRILLAKDGKRALELAAKEPRPDIILLDVMMPEMDGYAVIRELKSRPETRDIPVIFVTAKGESVEETRGLEIGASDYLVKPVNPGIVKARIRTQLENKHAKDILHRDREYLDRLVREKTEEVFTTQRVMMLGFSVLAETRDNETGGHIRRTEDYVRLLAEYAAEYFNEFSTVTESDIGLLVQSAPLHDIGKVGIPDAILNKPGKLEPEEFEIMKTHAAIGFEALKTAEGDGKSTPALRYAKEICLTHHEKWDGTGYPRGLSGGDIPFSGRIMAIADVYDALISERVYKKPFSHSKSCSIIEEGAGSHFDPRLVEAFINLREKFRQTALQYSDSEVQAEALRR